MDSFSTLAPARIRVLVLPVGRVERKQFSRFIQRLKREASVIPLADIESHVTLADLDLSPKSFPQGCLHYNFTTSPPSEQQSNLSPFELFREPLLVLGVVGGLRNGSEGGKSLLDSATAYLRERHPRVVHRQLLVLLEDEDDKEVDISSAIGVVNAERPNDPSLRTAARTLSARFLVELNTYAKALQASPSIATPGQSTTARSRPHRENEWRPTSGHRTPTKGSESQSPVEDASPARPESSGRGPPPTSFDQMTGTNGVPSALSRSDSRASNISDKGKSGKSASHQDHAPVQSKDKLRARGKARVGVVLGSIYMIAGLWKEALRILIEHTTKLRSLSDHLWHGKGLENISICLLLLAWKGVDFQIPALCNAISDRNSASHVPRLSAIIPVEPASGESVHQASIRRFAKCIPDLSKMILSLYRSIEGSLELPFIAIAEATVRWCKLLAILANHNGDMPPPALQQLISSSQEQSPSLQNLQSSHRAPVAPKALSRNTIADMLAQVTSHNEDTLTTSERITLLSAIASTYSLLGLERKKAIIVKDLVVHLRKALIQARKVGAAEMGIHPAASLSTETGAETLLAIAEESGGINKLMNNVSEIYGATLMPEIPSESVLLPADALGGNPMLKVEILREFAALCEASPDPYGVLRLTSSLLRTGGPNAALEPSASSNVNAFSKEEQLQLAAVINRTVAVSKHLGLSNALAMYWDPFLVRGVMFPPPSSDLAIIDRTKVKAPVDDRIPGNPLLYDPNASRPGTALPQLFVLVKEEVSQCLLNLQNPFDVTVEIESCTLVMEGALLETQFKPITLGPMRIQSVPVTVHPNDTGETKITACKIKIQGCQEQIFPIVSAPWSAHTPLTLKEQPIEKSQSLAKLGVATQVVSTVTIDKMPILILDETDILDTGLMLLAGEKRALELTLRNISSITAYMFEITDTSGVIRHIKSSTDESLNERPSTASPDIVVEAGTSITVHLEITGRLGVSNTQVNFYYSVTNSNTSNHARLISVPLQLTVNPALQAQNFDIIPPHEDEDDDDDSTLQIMFDLRNSWSQPISYICSSPSVPSTSTLSHNESGIIPPNSGIHRVYLSLPRPNILPSPDLPNDSLISSFFSPLKISWSIPQDDRTGQLNLLSPALPKLSDEALSLLRLPPIKLEISLEPAGKSGIKVGTYIRITLTLTLWGSEEDLGKGPLGVQLLALGREDEDKDEDEEGAPPSTNSPSVGRGDKRFAIVGTMKRTLPRFPSRPAQLPGGSKEHKITEKVEFVICPLLAGRLEFEGLVHPAWLGTEDEEGKVGKRRDWCARRRVGVEVLDDDEDEKEDDDEEEDDDAAEEEETESEESEDGEEGSEG